MNASNYNNVDVALYKETYCD